MVIGSIQDWGCWDLHHTGEMNCGVYFLGCRGGELQKLDNGAKGIAVVDWCILTLHVNTTGAIGAECFGLMVG